MTTMVLERVPPSLRGDLSRWLIEISTGVFVGRVSRRVREGLWERCVHRADGGTVLQVWATNTEQGYDLRYHNPKGRIPIRIEDVWLVQIVDPDPGYIP